MISREDIEALATTKEQKDYWDIEGETSMKQNDLVKKTMVVSTLSKKGTKKNKKIHNTKVRVAAKKYIKNLDQS